MNGWQKDLSSLQVGRSEHGCGHYINSDNKVVLLVTGGLIADGMTASTEIYRDTENSWKTIGNLPRPFVGLSGVSFVSNHELYLIMTGGMSDDDTTESNQILSFNIKNNAWDNVGEMSKPRSEHG